MHCINSYVVFAFAIFIVVCADEKYKGNCVFGYKGESHDGFRVLNKLDGHRYFTKYKDGKTEYTYNFAICDNVQNTDSKDHVGLTQTYKGDDGETKTKIVGRYNAASFMKGGDWLILEYGNGENYTTKCGGNKEPRTARIMIMCDSSETEGKFKHIEEMKDKDSECFYLFELQHEAACDEKEYSLSVGSILCIVFFSLVVVYLIVGFIVQRVRGAQGWEQLPNYSFWKAIGNYAADGCNLVFRSSDSAARQYRSTEGMDQEIPRSTGEPDDHLLSM